MQQIYYIVSNCSSFVRNHVGLLFTNEDEKMARYATATEAIRR